MWLTGSADDRVVGVQRCGRDGQRRRRVDRDRQQVGRRRDMRHGAVDEADVDHRHRGADIGDVEQLEIAGVVRHLGLVGRRGRVADRRHLGGDRRRVVGESSRRRGDRRREECGDCREHHSPTNSGHERSPFVQANRHPPMWAAPG